MNTSIEPTTCKHRWIVCEINAAYTKSFCKLCGAQTKIANESLPTYTYQHGSGRFIRVADITPDDFTEVLTGVRPPRCATSGFHIGKIQFTHSGGIKHDVNGNALILCDYCGQIVPVIRREDR